MLWFVSSKVTPQPQGCPSRALVWFKNELIPHLSWCWIKTNERCIHERSDAILNTHRLSVAKVNWYNCRLALICMFCFSICAVRSSLKVPYCYLLRRSLQKSCGCDPWLAVGYSCNLHPAKLQQLHNIRKPCTKVIPAFFSCPCYDSFLTSKSLTKLSSFYSVRYVCVI